MSVASHDPRAAYFDSIAEAWDEWHDRAAVQRQLYEELAAFHLGPAEVVLDVGCGTGNLTAALLRCLSSAGRVVAVDMAARMIAVARTAIDDPRVRWVHASVERLPVATDSIDRAICFSVWPHVANPTAAAQELRRVLRPGGRLHIWHLASRQRINEIHANADAAVERDLLLPASEVARGLERAGFAVETRVDDVERYLITAHSEPEP